MHDPSRRLFAFINGNSDWKLVFWSIEQNISSPFQLFFDWIVANSKYEYQILNNRMSYQTHIIKWVPLIFLNFKTKSDTVHQNSVYYISKYIFLQVCEPIVELFLLLWLRYFFWMQKNEYLSVCWILVYSQIFIIIFG